MVVQLQLPVLFALRLFHSQLVLHPMDLLVGFSHHCVIHLVSPINADKLSVELLNHPDQQKVTVSLFLWGCIIAFTLALRLLVIMPMSNSKLSTAIHVYLFQFVLRHFGTICLIMCEL